jgi:phosphatidylglycerophosphatase C
MTDVAAFDFDGTLTTGGSVFSFLVAVRGAAPVLATSARLAPRLARAALAGGSTADRTKEDLFVRLLAGQEAAAVEAIARTFARDHLARRVRTDARRRLDWHRARGDLVVIVSASPECYVRHVGERLGAAGVVATRLEVDGSGKLTGRYDGSNCRGQEKLRRLDAWIDDHGGRATGTGLWAYGNSRGDLALLRAADVGVNAGRLGRLGRLSTFVPLDQVGQVIG